MTAPDPRNVRDMLLEAGYSPVDVDLGLRALNHGRQDADDLSEAYFWLCAVAGWTFAGGKADVRTGVLRVARCLIETGLWRHASPVDRGQLWPGVRPFGTESP